MTKLSDEEIAAGLRLAEAATPGEWIIHWNDGTPLSVAVFDQRAYESRHKGEGSAFWHRQVVGAWCAKVPDLEFIAAARTLLPAALLELQSLRQQIAAARDGWRERADHLGLTAGHAFRCNADELDTILKGTIDQPLAPKPLTQASAEGEGVKMAKRDLQPIIELLHAAGWTDDGRTAEDTVRVPTSRAPVFGGIGGEVRTYGGRRRFSKGEHRCTIGPRVVCFYRWVDREASQFVRFPSSHIDAIRTHVVGVDPAEVFDPELRPGEPTLSKPTPNH